MNVAVTTVPAARAGFSPLDRQLELGVGVWSEGLQREAVFLSGAVSSFELAKRILNRIGQINISQPGAWRCAQEAGARFHGRTSARQCAAGAVGAGQKWQTNAWVCQ